MNQFLKRYLPMKSLFIKWVRTFIIVVLIRIKTTFNNNEINIADVSNNSGYGSSNKENKVKLTTIYKKELTAVNGLTEKQLN